MPACVFSDRKAELISRVTPVVLPGARAAAAAGARTADGAVSADGERGLAPVRGADAKWTTPRLAHAEGWRPAASPKRGPNAAGLGRQVTVGWYTEAPDRPRVVAAFSGDAGG